MSQVVRVAALRDQMVRAELMGGHSHTALGGTQVHVWKRGPKYLARGRFQGRPFGETIGQTEAEAAARLRQLLNEIEGGAYVRPSEARTRPLAKGKVPRLSLRQLADEFLVEKRRIRGKQTAGDYRSRLVPILAFAEQVGSRKRWPLAADLDREFVVSLRAFLFEYQTTRNGRPGSTTKSFSQRQVVNVLESLRTLLAWAVGPAVGKLPLGWANPVTPDLVGSPPAKDPHRDDQLPLGFRVRLARRMDRWQLCHLGLSLVLPLRPDEAAGLLVSDVRFSNGWLEFGHAFTDCNFTKGRTSFRLPYPDELRPLLEACVQGRVEGPLLRSRKSFTEDQQTGVDSTDELKRLYEETTRTQRNGAVQTAHDRKLLFRSLLRRLGGVAEDDLNREFKKLLAAEAITTGATLYTLRGSVTRGMKDANLPHLEMRYLTSHSTTDILNEYTGLDPVGAMRRYFETITPLLEAITDRGQELGLVSSTSSPTGNPENSIFPRNRVIDF